MRDGVVIRVEGLGKKYLIGHEAERGSYVALRDVLVRAAKNIGRKTGDMLRGGQIVIGDTVEEFWALKDVSFEIKRGEVLGIIGRNGAGKSTLLKILSRITEPSEGRVTINGRVASLLEVGTGFHPELTGRENVYLNGAILGMKRAEIKRKFDEIVSFAEIEKFLDTPVKRYSSGMYVRLAFAVAAHLEPEILIVDEVLAVGDFNFQRKCLGKMQQVSDELGRTVIFVSHDLAAVEKLTNRCLIVDGGIIKFDGSTEKAVSEYISSGISHRGVSPAAELTGCHTRVLKATLLEEPLRETNYYFSDCPLILEFEMETDGRRGMSFDLYISNSRGQRIYYYCSALFDEIDLPTTAGRYRIRCKFNPLMLAADDYSIDIATAHTNVGYDHYLSGAIALTVPKFSYRSKSAGFVSADGYGIVAMKRNGDFSTENIAEIVTCQIK